MSASGGPPAASHCSGCGRSIAECSGCGRELTLGDLGTESGMLGGINAIIVGNYLTTLGRPAGADLDMLARLKMPIKALSATL